MRRLVALAIASASAFTARNDLADDEIDYRRRAAQRSLDEMRAMWCVGDRSASEFCVKWSANDAPPDADELREAHEYFCSHASNADAPPCRRLARKKRRRRHRASPL